MPIQSLDLSHLLSSTDAADFSARTALSDVSKAVTKARRVVVVSGAGISCSSGIPDFRSADGLYSLVKAKYPDAFFTGKDLFSSGLFSNPLTTSLFYTFIAELSRSCLAAQPTKTHHFIRKLEQKGKLLRSYTQNVDGLERRIGLESGGRGKGLSKKFTRNVELHGDLGRVRCVLCFCDFEAQHLWVEMFRQGEAPECPKCLERCEYRVSRSCRATAVGTLRPSIVLYDEPHPLGDDIGQLQTYDLYRQPDMLLIMGTSLKVHGLKRLVKEFAKAVHAKKGKVVFVNMTAPSKEWEGVIDVHIQGETDRWVERCEEEWRRIKPADWEVQTRLDDAPVVKSTTTVPTTKGKGKAKALTSSEKENLAPPVQLPTPRPSQSPRSPAKHPSSPTSISKIKLPIGESKLPSAPPTPLSPSKRRANGVSIQSPTKKSRSFDTEPPKTGLPATPGRGNLFASPKKLVSKTIEQDDEEEVGEDEWEVFGSPKKALPLTRNKGSGRRIANVRSKEEGKENISAAVGRARKARTVTSSPKVRRTRMITSKA